MALHSQLDELINTMLPFVQQFHAKNQLAPHAAFINTDGELLGVAITDKDVSSDVEFSVLDAITHFELQFQKAAKANEIIASAIFFHGIGIIEPQKPAQTEEEAHTIVVLLEHQIGESVSLIIPYEVVDGTIQYHTGRLISKPISVFSSSF
jgi:hypothetical protein